MFLHCKMVFTKDIKVCLQKASSRSFSLQKINTIKATKTFCTNCINESSRSPIQSNPRVVFLGSDSFAIPSLIALTNTFDSNNVTVVISNPNNIVDKFARKLSLRTTLWNDFKTKEQVSELGSDESKPFYLGVVASFGHLIPKTVIDMFSKGIFNVHPSLLPKYRGAAPINHAIINGDTETGVSIMRIAAHKFDVGPVFRTKIVTIHPDVRAPELNTILSRIGAAELKEVLKNLEQHLENPKVQSDDGVSSARKLTSEMGIVNWNEQISVDIYNLFRGLSGSFKLKTTYDNRQVYLDEVGLLKLGPQSTSPLPLDSKTSSNFTVATDFSQFYTFPVSWNVSSLPLNALPGHVIFKNDVLCIKCSDSCVEGSTGWIFAHKIKIGDSRWMTAKDFENGFLKKGRKRGIFRFEFLQNSSLKVAI